MYVMGKWSAYFCLVSTKLGLGKSAKQPCLAQTWPGTSPLSWGTSSWLLLLVINNHYGCLAVYYNFLQQRIKLYFIHFVIFKVIDDTRHHASIWTSKWTFRATATRTIRHCRWMKRQFYHQKYCTAKNRQKRMSGQSTGDNRIVA